MPDWRAEIRERLAPLRLLAHREQEIADELAQHLEDRYADLRARGSSDADAARTVREELAREPLIPSLAGVEHPMDDRDHQPLRATSAASVASSFWRDLRYGARALRKAPGFTAVATLTLALGIGATTAMFSVLNAVLLRPLPFPQPEQLVRLYGTYEKSSGGITSFSAADFLAMHADGRVLSSVAMYTVPSEGFSFVSGERAERVFGTVVSADFFKTLGVRPMLGRAFQPGDDADGAQPIVVLGYGFWQRRLGGDAGVIGKQLNIQGRPATVIGVMPASVWFPSGRLEFWMNDNFATPKRRGPFGWAAIGRLNPAVSDAERRTVFDQVAAGIRTQFPGGPQHWTFVTHPLSQQFSGDLGPVLVMLMGAVVVVLLIACVNVTNLMLARATSRAQEIAVRTALGASRMTLVRQLLTESALLAALGGAVGVVLAIWGMSALLARSPNATMLHDLGVGLDGRVLAIAAVAAMGSVLLFGLAPALLGAPAIASGSMRESARGGTDARSRRRLRSGLVAAEFALSLVLLIGAGLLIRSMSKLRQVDTGVRTDGVVTASISLPNFRYVKPEQIIAFHDRLLGELRAVPGVGHASAAIGLPPDVFGSSSDFFVTSHPVAEGEFSPIAATLVVDGDYFAALDIPLRAGRVFDSRDNSSPNSPATVIVSSALAKKYFPTGDAVGQRLNIGGIGDANAYTIVGIVGDVRYEGVSSSSTIAMYQPFAQFPMGLSRSFSVVVQTPMAAIEVASSLRAAVRAIDPELAIAKVRTVHDLVNMSVADDEFRTALLALFALLALVLAGIGIYGVMAYAVGRRAREIGIRLALGARSRQVYALILREGLTVAVTGITTGIVLSFVATRVVSKLLFGVSATDSLTFATAPLVLLAIATVACIVPARRAARVDPAVTMRGD